MHELNRAGGTPLLFDDVKDIGDKLCEFVAFVVWLRGDPADVVFELLEDEKFVGHMFVVDQFIESDAEGL